MTWGLSSESGVLGRRVVGRSLALACVMVVVSGACARYVVLERLASDGVVLVRVGDSADAVRAALGEPTEVADTPSGRVRWVYGDRSQRVFIVLGRDPSSALTVLGIVARPGSDGRAQASEPSLAGAGNEVTSVDITLGDGARSLQYRHLTLVPLKQDARGAWQPGSGRRYRSRIGQTLRAHFDRLPVGHYAAIAHKDGWSIGCGVIECGPGSDSEYTLPVSDSCVRVSLRDSYGRPVQRAHVGLSSRDEWCSVSREDHDPVRGRNGVYRIPCARDGLYTAFVYVLGAQAESDECEVNGGAHSANASLLLPSTGSLSVQVLDSRGVAVSDAPVSIQFRGTGLRVSRETDKRGRVLFADLAVGAWVVGAGEESWLRVPDNAMRVRVEAGRSSPVTLRSEH